MPLLLPKSVEVAALILHIVYVLCIIVALASFFLHKCGLDLSNAECHWSQNQIPHCIAEQLATHENVNGHIFFKSSNAANT